MSSKRHHHKHKRGKPNDGKPIQNRGPGFEIRKSNIMGRYMAAVKQYNPGDIILTEPPLAIGPCSGSSIQCLACYKPLSTFHACAECNWPLCSPHCPAIHTPFGHSTAECALLKTALPHSLNYAHLPSLFNTIVPLRCLLLKTTDSDAYNKLIVMETHNAIRRQIPELWQTNETNVVTKIRDHLGFKQFTSDEIHSICGILEVNSFDIGQEGASVRGLYPTAFLLSHDCVPNTNHCCDPTTFALTIRASIPIAPDAPITLSYASTLQSTLKRRAHLLENKFFQCACARCADPTELGAFSGALLCPKCRHVVLSTMPLDADAAWSCTNANCQGYTISGASMTLLLDKIGDEADRIDCNDVGGYEALLDRYRNVLHASHYLCLGVKLSLSQIYGRIDGWLIDELSEGQLKRKLAVCEEILGVFDVIEPGWTRLRGVTLYEAHAPMMVLLTRQFEGHCSRSEVRARLKRIVGYLREAALILGLEPEGTPEGAMGRAAEDALRKVRTWEAILGKF